MTHTTHIHHYAHTPEYIYATHNLMNIYLTPHILPGPIHTTLHTYKTPHMHMTDVEFPSVCCDYCKTDTG